MGAPFTPLAVPGLALSLLCHVFGMPTLGGPNALHGHDAALEAKAFRPVSANAPSAPRMSVRDFAESTPRPAAEARIAVYSPAPFRPAFVVPPVIQDDPAFYTPLKPLTSVEAAAPSVQDTAAPSEPLPAVPSESDAVLPEQPQQSVDHEQAQSQPQPQPESGEWRNANAALEQQELALFVMVNRERQSRGLQPLTLSPLLCQVARAHSEDMYQRNYFDHIAPAPGPSSPLDRYLAAAPQRPASAMLGENIYYRSATDSISDCAAESHDAFMHSPGHRANILTPQYDQAGIGIYRNPATGEFWVTEEFLTVSP